MPFVQQNSRIKWSVLANRVLEFGFAASLISLGAYTLSIYPDWVAVRFTVAAVSTLLLNSDIQGTFTLLSLFYVFVCGMRYHPNHPHQFVTLMLDVVNWCLLLALWVWLANQIASKPSNCTSPGGEKLQVRSCQAFYSACAISVASWSLYTISVGHSFYTFRRRRVSASLPGDSTSLPEAIVTD